MGGWRKRLDRKRPCGGCGGKAGERRRACSPGREGGSSVEIFLFLSLVLFACFYFLLYTVACMLLFFSPWCFFVFELSLLWQRFPIDGSGDTRCR